jgi:hypothetical protein
MSDRPTTIGQLRASGYADRTVKEELRANLHGQQRIRSFLVDAYSADHGRSELEAQIRSHIGSANVIMASLGPKITAVALYQIHATHPETTLVYAPSGEYNHSYSMGIGETSYGII